MSALPARQIAAISIIAIGSASAVSGGAWTQPRGHYYAKASVLHFESTEFLDQNGNRTERLRSGELSDLSVITYIEYGVTDDLTLVISAPYRRLEDKRTFTGQGIAIERVRRLGDLELRARHRLPLSVGSAVALGAKIPMGYDISEDLRVPPGTGEIDADVRLLVGQSLHPQPAYVTGEIGFRRRGGTISDDLFASLEGGYTHDHVTLKGYAAGVSTSGSCSERAQGDLVGDQDLLKLTPGLIYRASKRIDLSIELSVLVSGCNTAAGNSVIFGVALRN